MYIIDLNDFDNLDLDTFGTRLRNFPKNICVLTPDFWI